MSPKFAFLTMIFLVAAADSRADDKDKFQGTWKAEKATRAGKPYPPEAGKTFEIEFKGNEVIMNVGGEVQDSGKMTLAEVKKVKTIDFRSDLLPEEPIKGIYEIDGDNLKICFAIEGERPTKFESPADSVQMLIVLKRIKK